MPNNSGFKPFFLTGANAKIIVNGKVCGYASDFAITQRIVGMAPKVLGMYESETIETQSYDIVGSFTLIRYINGVKNYYTSQDSPVKVPSHVSNSGNSVQNYVPSSFLLSALREAEFFNIEVYQKLEGGVADDKMVFKVHKCKILASDAVINKRNLLTQNIMFMGCYLDDDALSNDSSKTDGETWAPISDNRNV